MNSLPKEANCGMDLSSAAYTSSLGFLATAAEAAEALPGPPIAAAIAALACAFLAASTEALGRPDMSKHCSAAAGLAR